MQCIKICLLAYQKIRIKSVVTWLIQAIIWKPNYLLLTFSAYAYKNVDNVFCGYHLKSAKTAASNKDLK